MERTVEYVALLLSFNVDTSARLVAQAFYESLAAASISRDYGPDHGKEI